MVIAVQQIRPIAHLPLILGVLRRLEVATLVDSLIPLHPEHVVAAGRRVEALVLAMLDGDHVLYEVGHRLEERAHCRNFKTRSQTRLARANDRLWSSSVQYILAQYGFQGVEQSPHLRLAHFAGLR